MKPAKIRRNQNPGIVRVRRGIRTYSIPVDASGNVPLWAIVQRYQEVGGRRDKDVSDDIVLPQKITPEEIADWWADPACCDISGVDTEDSQVYAVPASIRGRKRKALKEIGIVADKKEAARIKKVLADSFTAEELEQMAGGKSLVVRTEKHLDDCTGYYLRRQPGVEVPTIVMEDGTTTDGIVHEAVHHLRMRDGRTSFPTAGDRLDARRYSSMPKAQRDKVVQDEEQATVIETVCRTAPDPVQSGYYDLIPGKDSRKAYLEDQERISGNKAMKGKRAKKTAELKLADSNIALSIIESDCRRRRR